MMMKKKRPSLSLARKRTSPRWHRTSVPSNLRQSLGQSPPVLESSYSAVTPQPISCSSPQQQQHLKDTPPPGISLPSLPISSSPASSSSSSQPVELHVEGITNHGLHCDTGNIRSDHEDTCDHISKRNSSGNCMGGHGEATGGVSDYGYTGDHSRGNRARDTQIDGSQSTFDCVRERQYYTRTDQGCQEGLDDYQDTGDDPDGFQDSQDGYHETGNNPDGYQDIGNGPDVCQDSQDGYQDSTTDFPDDGDFLDTAEEIEAQLSAALSNDFLETSLVHQLPPSSYQLSSQRKASGVKKQTSLLSFMTSKTSIKGKRKMDVPRRDIQPQNGRKGRDSSSIWPKRHKMEGRKQPQQLESIGERGHKNRTCPFYKKIPGRNNFFSGFGIFWA